MPGDKNYINYSTVNNNSQVENSEVKNIINGSDNTSEGANQPVNNDQVDNQTVNTSEDANQSTSQEVIPTQEKDLVFDINDVDFQKYLLENLDIDTILDKINELGLESLNDIDKRVLNGNK